MLALRCVAVDATTAPILRDLGVVPIRVPDDDLDYVVGEFAAVLAAIDIAVAERALDTLSAPQLLAAAPADSGELGDALDGLTAVLADVLAHD